MYEGDITCAFEWSTTLVEENIILKKPLGTEKKME